MGVIDENESEEDIMSNIDRFSNYTPSEASSRRQSRAIEPPKDGKRFTSEASGHSRKHLVAMNSAPDLLFEEDSRRPTAKSPDMAAQKQRQSNRRASAIQPLPTSPLNKSARRLSRRGD